MNWHHFWCKAGDAVDAAKQWTAAGVLVVVAIAVAAAVGLFGFLWLLGVAR